MAKKRTFSSIDIREIWEEPKPICERDFPWEFKVSDNARLDYVNQIEMFLVPYDTIIKIRNVSMSELVETPRNTLYDKLKKTIFKNARKVKLADLSGSKRYEFRTYADDEVGNITGTSNTFYGCLNRQLDITRNLLAGVSLSPHCKGRFYVVLAETPDNIVADIRKIHEEVSGIAVDA